jgi:hypothetical protein
MKKAAVISALNEFPKEFNLDDLVEQLIVIEKIEAGLADVKQNKTTSHAEVKKLVKKWRK